MAERQRIMMEHPGEVESVIEGRVLGAIAVTKGTFMDNCMSSFFALTCTMQQSAITCSNYPQSILSVCL